jgi:hypothetical protein
MCPGTQVSAMGSFGLCCARAFTFVYRSATLHTAVSRRWVLVGMACGTTACLASLFHLGVISYSYLHKYA